MAASIIAVAMQPDRGSLGVGGTVTLTLTADRAIGVDTAGGSPTLALNSGGAATYAGVGPDGRSLVFTYAVLAGHNAADLDVTALVPNGAVIYDTAGGEHVDVAGAADAEVAGTLAIDTAAPGAPSIAGLTPDTGAAGDRITKGDSTNRITLAGTAEAGSTVTVFASKDGGATFRVGTATAGAGGAWGLRPAALADGGYAFTATATDAAGNRGAASATFAMVMDDAAPSAPSITSVQDDVGPVTGALAGGAVTDDTRLVVRVGLADTGARAGDTVRLYSGTGTGSPLGSARAITGAEIGGGFADLSTSTLANGTTYNITARITDAADNRSAASIAFAATVDTAAPALAIAGTGGRTGKATRTVAGTAEAGSTVALSEGAAGLGTVRVGADGTWGVGVALSGEGAHVLTATATDAAGNQASRSVIHTLDTVAPAAISVAASPGAGPLRAGAGVTFTVTLDEAVAVTPAAGGGVPTLALSNGGTASYTGTDQGGKALAFDYTVQPGQDAAGLRVTRLDLNGATIAGPGGPILQAERRYGTASGPYSVAVADLNGDGAPDLVTADYDGAELSVLLGDGRGGFGPKTDYATASGPYSVAVADLNGDGTPDLVATNTDGGASVSVLLGDGRGGFAPKTDHGVGSGPRSIAVADVDGDGKPDLVAANGGGSSVSVLLGDGRGGFAPKTDHATGTAPYSVAVADMDGDGTPDLVAANYGASSVSVLPGVGRGGFAAKTDHGVGSQPRSVAVADVDGDGGLDLVAANGDGRSVSVLANRGVTPPEPLDASGIAALPGGDTGLTVDTRTPGAPVITGAGGPTNRAARTVSGTAEANSTVELFDGAASLGTAAADADGDWTKDVALSGEGAHVLTAGATDAAGNTGASSAPVTYVLDTTAAAVVSVAASPGDAALRAGGEAVFTVTFERRSA